MFSARFRVEARVITAAMMSLFLAGCLGTLPSLPPEEALARAHKEVSALLGKHAQETALSGNPIVLEPDGTRPPEQVLVWFPTHRLAGPALMEPDRLKAFRQDYPGIELKAQYMGDWQYAVQKLMVSMAADTPPDVAVIERDWVGPLAHAGRILPIEAVVGDTLLSDLRPEARAHYLIDGVLYALPADAYCSLLYVNTALAGTGKTPKNWDELLERAGVVSKGEPSGTLLAVGAFPYLEALWSTGGEPYLGLESELDQAGAMSALHYLLSLRDQDFARGELMQSEGTAFDYFERGRIAMTVASGSKLSQINGKGISYTVGPVPGENGPVARFEGLAIVVFARDAEMREPAIQAVLDYLTGEHVQGGTAWDEGSAPVRRSVYEKARQGEAGAIREAVDEAFRSARSTPLDGIWNQVEGILVNMVDSALRWKPESAVP